ncbi:hypothetical protein C6P61_09685 [Malikia spinosa]|uniref:Uncharacterized protein n=1 Tax=Malikia spinosa TaxID=86180 RepID=A0A2S9KED3_9BURK|nr:hypothetical protein [Malikia spinosa]PRD68762.1 hypothetical protein C6P61_09685 [Malikia spinosa]
MKFTTEELLLAAEIGKRRIEMARAMTRDMTAEEVEVFRRQRWDELAKLALEELEGVASVIATLRHQQDESHPPR